ncbi:MAG: M14 family zinc carboxypeptidase, partial [Bacteroidota bacterium]
MNRKFIRLSISLIFIGCIHQLAFSQDIEKLNRDNISISWADCIAAYKKLDVENKSAQLIEAGLTDVGKPLHLFVLSKDGIFDPVVAKRKGKTVLMILNGIHPGEPDGIDASIRLSQNLLSGKNELPSNLIICIIPVYNIDGSLNNRCCTRANQNGPINQGFRGNARNLDLNRDFIKCDSENAKSFTKIFRDWDPDVFVDTHVSNGADYQHVMTLISTQHNKLGGASGEFMKKQMTPALFVAMEKRGFPMSPYVNTLKYDYPPENGIYGFMETPRFASGYAALYQSLAFVTETHMLKPFPLRVDATQAMLEEFIKYTSANAEDIREARRKDRSAIRSSTTHVIDWKVDTNIVEFVPFLGFEPYYQKSPVTGQDQLYYDRGKPFNRNVKFYDEYVASKTVKIPAFYIVPQAWSEVIERLKLNKIEFMRLNRDTVIELSTYTIGNYKSSSKPYEGHYTRSETEIVEENKRMKLYEGDYMIPTDQDAIRYLIETLE